MDFNSGLIVSIQGYSRETTQSLAEMCVSNGAAGIRTDQKVILPSTIMIIACRKNKRKYYINTTKEDIDKSSEISNLIALDCRDGRKEIGELMEYCISKNIKIVADIEKPYDVVQLFEKFYLPSYISTTFAYQIFRTGFHKEDIISDILTYTSLPIIAEGGYVEDCNIRRAIKNGASYVCIGDAIGNYWKKTKKYSDIINGIISVAVG